jgi:translation initiation factor 5B
MAPKKKGNKKAQDDDWEAELGESVAPRDGAAVEAKPEDVPAEDDASGGGLMAALAKRGKKKNKKGANPEVEGEDPPPVDGADEDFESKAPQEGTFDGDDDDVFAGNYGKKKGKGAAAAKVEEPVEEPVEATSESPADGAPRVKTKAEKEKEKKEKEKQRKKELVRFWHAS